MLLGSRTIGGLDKPCLECDDHLQGRQPEVIRAI